ncbi:MAG: hypothetical protein WAV90_00495 [Gordonia amarae]
MATISDLSLPAGSVVVDVDGEVLGGESASESGADLSAIWLTYLVGLIHTLSSRRLFQINAGVSL